MRLRALYREQCRNNHLFEVWRSGDEREDRKPPLLNAYLGKVATAVAVFVVFSVPRCMACNEADKLESL